MKLVNYIDEMVKEALEITINQYGIEGTEDCINRVYSRHPKTKEYVLRIFKNMINRS